METLSFCFVPEVTVKPKCRIFNWPQIVLFIYNFEKEGGRKTTISCLLLFFFFFLSAWKEFCCCVIKLVAYFNSLSGTCWEFFPGSTVDTTSKPYCCCSFLICIWPSNSQRIPVSTLPFPAFHKWLYKDCMKTQPFRFMGQLCLDTYPFIISFQALEKYPNSPMTAKQILEVIQKEGLKETRSVVIYSVFLLSSWKPSRNGSQNTVCWLMAEVISGTTVGNTAEGFCLFISSRLLRWKVTGIPLYLPKGLCWLAPVQ